MTFLLLGIGYLHRNAKGLPNPPIIKAGGFFGLLAAFTAWYNALAGILDDSNRSVRLKTMHLLRVYSPSAQWSANLFLFLQLLRHPRRALPVVNHRIGKAR